MTAPYKTRRGVLTSAGSSDAGAIPLLGPLGLLDPSFLATQSSYRAGVDTAPVPGPSSRFQTFKAVLFSAPFPTGVVPVILITPQSGPFAGGNGVTGYGVDFWIQNGTVSESGFTVVFNSNHGESNADGDIINPVVFGWLAIAPA